LGRRVSSGRDYAIRFPFYFSQPFSDHGLGHAKPFNAIALAKEKK
jgi:hypothetical protein